MATLSNIYIKKDMLQKLIEVLDKKGEKGISIDLSTNEESNEYGQNVSAYVSQTKEQRDAKKPRFYVGNGKVFWTDGKVTLGSKKNETHTAVPIKEEQGDGLPF